MRLRLRLDVIESRNLVRSVLTLYQHLYANTKRVAKSKYIWAQQSICYTSSPCRPRCRLQCWADATQCNAHHCRRQGVLCSRRRQRRRGLVAVRRGGANCSWPSGRERRASEHEKQGACTSLTRHAGATALATHCAGPAQHCRRQRHRRATKEKTCL